MEIICYSIIRNNNQTVDYRFLSSYSSAWLERHSYKVEVTGSNPVGSTF